MKFDFREKLLLILRWKKEKSASEKSGKKSNLSIRGKKEKRKVKNEIPSGKKEKRKVFLKFRRKVERKVIFLPGERKKREK